MTESLDRTHLLLQVAGKVVVELVLEEGEGSVESTGEGAEVVEDDDSEPEVRKAAPTASAVPVKSSKLASIVSDWDDE